MANDVRPRSRSEELLLLAEWDWVITDVGECLHHLAAFDDPIQAGKSWGGSGTTSCGRHSLWLMIPGYFTRGGARRCGRCCKAVGYPPGYGSPKNDDACRPLVEARLGRP